MTITQHIENLFGLEAKIYFKHKQTGGNANQKGSRYEDFFSVMQLAQLFRLLIQADDDQDIEIYAQAEAFVDDLLIVYKNHNSQHHFQLKTTPTVAWGEGLKSIGDDFCKQKMLNDQLGISKTHTFLVCANKKKAEILKQNRPIMIADFTDVVFFPEAETINQLLLTHSEFKALISCICLSDDSDKLEALAKLIFGHWGDKKTTLFSVKALLSSLQNTFPNYLAKTDVTAALLPEAERILANILHFSYNIERGYFSWHYGHADSGTLPYPVDHKEFLAFQHKIISERPKQFDELEGIL